MFTGSRSTTCWSKTSASCWSTPRTSSRNRRKTDVADCAWLAQLLEHALLRASFVPPQPIRELRDLTRLRKSLIQDSTRVTNRLHKVLEDSGIKLSSVAANVLGASGRAMLSALMSGTSDLDQLAPLARGKLRNKLPALRQALAGRFRDHHAFLVGSFSPTSITWMRPSST